MTKGIQPRRRPAFRRFAVIAAAAIVAVSLTACFNRGAATSGGTVHFVNSPANAQAPALARDYVDFSFDYPSDWKVNPETGTPTAPNFVKVERLAAAGSTIESFAVGHFHGSGNAQADQALLPQLLGQLEAQITPNFPNYRRVDYGQITVAGLPGQQFRFTAVVQGQGTTNVFGRVIILPGPAGSQNGVVLLMLTTDIGGIIRGIDDVGVNGELPVILNSFRLGR